MDNLFTLAENYIKRQEALKNPTDSNEKISFLKGNIPNRYSSRDVVSFDTTNVGYRNRGDYSPVHGNSALTLFHPLKEFTGDEKANSFIGIRNGKLIAGNKNIFRRGDLVSPTFSNTIKGILKKDGMIQSELGRNKDNPNKYVPLMQMADGGIGSLNMLMQNQYSLDKYGGIQGGQVLLQVGDKYVAASGSIRDIDKAIDNLKRETGSDTVKVFALDNGSFSNGLKKKGVITSEDLRNYDHLNSAGGNYIYTKKTPKPNDKRSFNDIVIESARKHGLKIGELNRSMESALDNYRRGVSQTLLSQHLTGNAVDFINPTNAQMDSVLADVQKVYPNAEHGRNWKTLYDPHHLQSNANISIADNMDLLAKEYLVAKDKYGEQEAKKMFKKYVNNKELPLNKRVNYAYGYPDNLGDKIKSVSPIIAEAINKDIDIISNTGSYISDKIGGIKNKFNYDSNTEDIMNLLFGKQQAGKYINDIKQTQQTKNQPTSKQPIPVQQKQSQLADSIPVQATTAYDPNRTRLADQERYKAMEDHYRGQQAPVQQKPTQQVLVQNKSSQSTPVQSKPSSIGSRIAKAWSDRETKMISDASGIQLTTAERVQLGREIFGSNNPYRGTREQNAKLAEVLKNRAMNMMRPEAPKTREIPVDSDWLSEYKSIIGE